ncbi:MAG: hypothetical protein EXQ52_18635 [Bryobacterales bacterium]|nr:hypothetical protein [Bryobacterales bacterium]
MVGNAKKAGGKERSPTPLALALSLLFWACLAQAAELAIVSTHRAILPAMKAVAALRPTSSEATVVASGDCATSRAGLYLVVRPSRSKPAANLRTCTPKHGTRLALGIPLIDPSIASVPANSVNWTDEDRISSVVKLPTIGYVWIRRRYESDTEDPREGRRESVFFLLSSSKDAVRLDADCTNPTFAQRDGWIALSCARELAADHMLHELRVFEQATAKAIFTAARCREPRFETAEELSCQAESVDADGRLQLAAKRLRFRHQM